MIQAKIFLSFVWIGMLLLITPHIHTQEPSSNLSWKESLPGDFSAELTLSNLSLNITDSLTIHLTLTYPKTFTPQLTQLRKALLSHSDPTEPPFAVIRETADTPKALNEKIMQQQLSFSLSPQISGIHPLALGKITFIPSDTKNLQEQTLLIPIFRIHIEVPSTQLDPYMLIAPLMPLTKKLSITLSSTNRQAYTHNQQLAERATLDGLHAIEQKQFPWIVPLLIAVGSIVLLLIKYTPEYSPYDKSSISQTFSESPEKRALQAIDQLPITQNSSHYYRLDQIVRNYLYERYHINIIPHTTYEIIQKFQTEKAIPESSKKSLITFFEANDKKKFSNKKPSSEDYEATKSELKTLIQTLESF